MPLADVQFDEGIYYCREVGNITIADAECWTQHARRFTQMSDQPIIALIDAREVRRIDPQARQILADATLIDGLELAVVATQSYNARSASERIDEIAPDPHTVIFQEMTEARAFAQRKAAQFRQTVPNPTR